MGSESQQAIDPSRLGEWKETPRDPRPCRALHREYVVTMEIPTPARAVSAQFRTSLTSEDGAGGVGKSEAPIRAMIPSNVGLAKGRRFETADGGNMTRHRADYVHDN